MITKEAIEAGYAASTFASRQEVTSILTAAFAAMPGPAVRVEVCQPFNWWVRARPQTLASENERLWAAAAEKVVAQQTASLTASVMRHAAGDDTTAWDDVETKIDEAFINGMAHGQAAMPSGTFVTIDSEEMVIMRGSIAELEKRLADAAVVIEPFADCASEWDGEPDSLHVFLEWNDERKPVPSLPVADFRAARAYMEGK